MVICDHIPNLPANNGFITAQLFKRMRPNATFIRIANGPSFVLNDLVTIFAIRCDLTALLDTVSEPLTPGALIFELPNVQLSSYIAGAINDEVLRLADLLIEEFERWELGEAFRHEVTLQLLERLA